MKTIIIAEAGVNHNGSIDFAKKLIDVADESGADYVKFQTFKAKNIVSETAVKAKYQVENSIDDKAETQFEMLQKLEIDKNTHKELMLYTQNKRVKFLSTPFDEESVDLLYELGIRIFKIPSGEITNKFLLQKIGALNLAIILSTGMSTIQEIEDAICVLESSGTKRDKITVLHCNTEYPTPMKDVNLLAMKAIKEAIRVKVGYSDHTLGIEVPVAAVSLGAVLIEKHFTLDKNMEGPDHKASLEPEELKLMVESIRNIELALGEKKKFVSKSEKKNLIVARKSIHIQKSIRKGEIITRDVITAKRPGDGISPMNFEAIIGKKVKLDMDIDYKITLEDME